MLIKSLSLKNFQCYSGEFDKNHFNFKNGLNLIIGNNGNGKSKVFDGFYWVLYDQIFDTDMREFTSTETYGEKLISDKVTRNCAVGDTASAEACLVVENSQNREFRLTRLLHCTKVDENKWIREPSSLLIEEKKTNRWTPSNATTESILNMVIPAHIKPYMWFQGEQVDSLMDLTNKTSLTKIINLLSDIKVYDELIKITEYGAGKSSTKLRSAQRKFSSNQGESERLSKDYESNIEAIKRKEDDIISAKENLSDAKSKIDNLINKIDDATRKSELKLRKEEYTNRLRKSEEILIEKQKNFTSKIFKDYWILKFSKSSLNKFGEKYKSYFQQHQQVVNQQEQTSFKLPLNVPQPMHLHGMLSDEHCYICDREAKKGTEAYAHIEKLVQRNIVSKQDIFKCDCSDYFQHLYTRSLHFGHMIETTDERIANEFDGIAELKADIQTLKSDLDKVDQEFDSLIDSEKSESIISTYKRAQQNVEVFSAKLSKLEGELNKLTAKQEEIKNNLEKLTSNTLDIALINASNVFDSLAKIAKSTREDVYDGIITELEQKSNTIFKKMTASNTSFTGKIKLRRLDNGSCIPEIIDSEGYAMTGSNDSNIILVKLSLIMAILTARAKWSDNYTLISDAPTSKMAQEYSSGFYNALSHNFSQSIVMTYDFSDREDRTQFIHTNKQNLGSVHIVRSHYPNGNRDDRTDLETIIEAVSI